jgi:nucleoside 2-deoxyribosyltransferase
MKIYLAGPLFSLSEREFNKKISIELENRISDCEVILPQEMLYNFEETKSDFYKRIFKSCIDSIKEADILIAILDGSDTDSGTCIEMGYAYAINKPIIGVRTDFRLLEDKGVNLMVSRVCKEYIWQSNTSINYNIIIDEIIVSIKRIF